MTTHGFSNRVERATGLSVAFILILGAAAAWAVEVLPSPTMTVSPTTSPTTMAPATTVAPKASSASPNPLIVVPGGNGAVLTLTGANLDKISNCVVIRNMRIVSGATATLGTSVGTSRQVTVRATAGTVSGDAQLRIFAGTTFIDVPLNIVRVTFVVPPSKVASTSTTVTSPKLGTPASGIRTQSFPTPKLATTQTSVAAPDASTSPAPKRSFSAAYRLPLTYTQIVTYPGVPPIRTIADRLPSSNISKIRVARQGGGPTTGVDVKIAADPRGQRWLETTVRAGAVAGRYEIDYLDMTSGRWTTLQGNGLGLTVLDPRGGKNPLDVTLDLLDYNLGLVGSGADVTPEGLRESVGQSNPTYSVKEELPSESGSVGDTRLMYSRSGTYTSTTESNDVERSDGSKTMEQTITTYDHQTKQTMTDTMIQTTDKDGNTTSTQEIVVRDEDGNIIAQESSSSTPNPDDVSCTSKSCESIIDSVTVLLSPIVTRMKNLYFAKANYIKNYGDESTSSRSPNGEEIKSMAEKAVHPAYDPTPESGGASGDTQVPPIIPKIININPVDPPRR